MDDWVYDNSASTDVVFALHDYVDDFYSMTFQLSISIKTHHGEVMNNMIICTQKQRKCANTIRFQKPVYDHVINY